MTSQNEYHLEIYQPDDESCVAGSYTSDQPFMNISVGDTISPESMPNSPEPMLVRVTEINHIIFTTPNSGITHKVCMYTTAA